MARVSFSDLSSDDLNSSDESIFSDASDTDEEYFSGKNSGNFLLTNSPFLESIKNNSKFL